MAAQEQALALGGGGDGAEDAPEQAGQQQQAEGGQGEPAARAGHLHELVELLRRGQPVERFFAEDLSGHEFPRLWSLRSSLPPPPGLPGWSGVCQPERALAQNLLRHHPACPGGTVFGHQNGAGHTLSSLRHHPACPGGTVFGHQRGGTGSLPRLWWSNTAPTRTSRVVSEEEDLAGALLVVKHRSHPDKPGGSEEGFCALALLVVKHRSHPDKPGGEQEAALPRRLWSSNTLPPGQAGW